MEIMKIQLNGHEILDLTNYIENNLYQNLNNMLKNNKSKWNCVDEGYYEYGEHGKKDFSWLVLYPEILHYDYNSYEEKGISRQRSVLWLRSGDKEVTQEALDDLFKIVKPFKDEDYSGNDFWINPLVPDGWWCNHSLGSD